MADPTAAPALGYGNTKSTDLNTFNQWMRGQQGYQDLIKSFGQDPAHPSLNDAQKQQVVRWAQANGAVIDEGHNGQQVNDDGNFEAKSHLGRNIAIGAGIAGLALTGLGLAGVGPVAGLFGGGGAAADLGATGAAEAAGTGTAVGATGTGLATAAVPLEAASFPGVTAGLGTAGAATAAGAGAAGTGAGLAALPSTTVSPIGALGGLPSGIDAAGQGISLSSLDPATLAKVKDGTLSLSDALKGVGSAINNADQAAGQNRLNQEGAGLQANNQNISGTTAFENELINRAKEDQTQRSSALKDIYRQSYAQNPSVSPYNPAGAPKYSDAYKSALATLADQGTARIAQPSPYNLNTVAPITPYNPLNIKDVQGSTGTAPGTLAKIGEVAGPATGIVSALSKVPWGSIF